MPLPSEDTTPPVTKMYFVSATIVSVKMGNSKFAAKLRLFYDMHNKTATKLHSRLPKRMYLKRLAHNVSGRVPVLSRRGSSSHDKLRDAWPGCRRLHGYWSPRAKSLYVCQGFWSKSLSREAVEIDRENGVFCRSLQDLHGVILR